MQHLLALTFLGSMTLSLTTWNNSSTSLRWEGKTSPYHHYHCEGEPLILFCAQIGSRQAFVHAKHLYYALSLNAKSGHENVIKMFLFRMSYLEAEMTLHYLDIIYILHILKKLSSLHLEDQPAFLTIFQMDALLLSREVLSFFSRPLHICLSSQWWHPDLFLNKLTQNVWKTNFIGCALK